MSIATLNFAAAIRLLQKQIDEQVTRRMERWTEENPYWEIDGENGRPEHCPFTTDADARNAVCEELLAEADELGYYDFFELILHDLYGMSMRKDNKYRACYQQKQSQDISVLDNYFWGKPRA